MWSGICADFAAQPMKIAMQASKTVAGASVAAFAKTSAYAVEPVAANRTKTANIKPASPTTLMTNAFIAAATALGLKNQKPIRKYEARPTKPQPTSNPTKLSESTSVSIANTKKFMYAKKRAMARSDHM